MGSITAYIRTRLIFEIDRTELCRFRQVEHHRSRTAATSDIESPCYRGRYIFGITYLIAPFCNRQRDAQYIRFLKGVSTQQRVRHLSRNHYQRCRINHRIGNACDGVGSAGSGSYNHYSGLTAYARISLRSMKRPLFMTYQYMLELLSIII